LLSRLGLFSINYVSYFILSRLLGTLSPWVTGVVVDRTGHFALAFMAAAVMSALGVIGWLGMVPRLEPLKWDGIAPPAQERMSS